MNARQALEALLPLLDDEPAVFATGYIARTAQAVRRRPQDFHMIGSMGMVSSLATGVALGRPGRKVIAVDGDGAVLMNLGALPTAGALRVSDLVHVCLDNESYESTGAQASYSAAVALESVAAASGYRSAVRVTDADSLRREFGRALTSEGPSFLLVKVSLDDGPAAPRIEAAPERITADFKAALR
ncbi:MAG: hypothetical protein MOGMAGMI_01649 [Candidatus Omnitrophica bacterium]|nr:hypothetical protein [Candidatus Omnitrophota bacterium]